jgi:hypothetical protein
MKIDNKKESKPFGVHFGATHHTSVTQKPDHQYMPNPKSTRDSGESYENTGMTKLLTRTAK